MVEVHQMGGSEAEGYAPIVGAGPNSTALHYDRLSRKMEDGDIVVLDVRCPIFRVFRGHYAYPPRQW